MDIRPLWRLEIARKGQKIPILICPENSAVSRRKHFRKNFAQRENLDFRLWNLASLMCLNDITLKHDAVTKATTTFFYLHIFNFIFS